jgi:hypothetical protein
VALNDARSGAPEIHETASGPVVVLPRLLKDDYNVFVQEGAMRADRLAEAWLEGAAKLRTLEGLAVISGRTQILSTRGRIEALGTVTDTARAQGDWWLAEGREVADWWRLRRGIRLAFVDPPPEPEPVDAVAPRVGIPDLLVEAPEAPAPFDGLWVDVTLPGGHEGIVPWVEGTPSDFAVTSMGLRVPVGELGPGVVRRIVFRAEDGEGSER